MSLIDVRTSRVLITVLLFALVLGFLYVAHHTLIAFLFAVFFAYLVDPAVSRCEKWMHSRGGAIAVIYVLLLALLITFFFFVGPQIGRQAQKLTTALPTSQGKVNNQRTRRNYGGRSATNMDGAELQSTGERNFSVSIKTISFISLSGLVFGSPKSAQQSWLILVVPLLAAFFLRDGRAFSDVALSLVQTKPQREFLQGVLDDMNQMLAHFIRAQLTLAALSWVVYTGFMSAMSVPYALVLGTAGGVMEFIPVVGPLVAAVVIMGVAVLMTYPHWLVLLIFLAVWRLVQDYVISPRIMGRSLELHPLAAIFGVLAGAEIAGVLGVYLSIPVMASLRIVWRRWRLYAEKKRFGPLNDYSFGTEISPHP